jgi:ubiquitin C-terminal hydrolase
MELKQCSIKTCTSCKTETLIEEPPGVGLSVQVDLQPVQPTAPLFMGSTKTKKTMQNLLREYFSPYSLESDAAPTCSGCNQTVHPKRQLWLMDTPEYLVIQAKLFFYQNDALFKKNVYIEPDDISIIVYDSLDMNSVLYRVYAVVAHVGDRLDLGHYLTIACGSGCSAKNPTCASQKGCWWLFDDSDVCGPMLKEQAIGELKKRNVSIIKF